MKRVKQTRLESAIEVATDMSVAFLISWAVMAWVIPAVYSDINMGAGRSFGITLIFTVTSLIRSYIWRRLFENEIHKAVHSWAMEAFNGRRRCRHL